MMRRMFIFLLLIVSGCTLASSPQDSDGETAIENTQLPTATVSVALQPTRTVMPTALPLPPTRATSSGGVVPPAPSTGGGSSAPLTINIAPVSGAQAFALSENGGIASSGVSLFNNVTTFYYDQNPINPSRYAVIDTTGLLYLTDTGGANASRIDQGPYTGFPAASRESNNAAADVVDWSPDGQFVAFIVNGNQQPSDGVWYFQPGQFAPLQLIVDCPAENFPGCIITSSPDAIRRWESKAIEWSPDSQTLLVNADLPELSRHGLMVIGVTRNERVRDNRPAMILYDYGSWASDGRILVSGRNPQGLVEVAFLNRDGSMNQQVFIGGTLWLGWAVQQADGTILALGKPGNPDGLVAIYDMDGAALTPSIGTGFPQRVVWSAARDAVLVEVNGRRYIASVDGQVVDITDASAGLAVNWVR